MSKHELLERVRDLRREAGAVDDWLRLQLRQNPTPPIPETRETQIGSRPIAEASRQWLEVFFSWLRPTVDAIYGASTARNVELGLGHLVTNHRIIDALRKDTASAHEAIGEASKEAPGTMAFPDFEAAWILTAWFKLTNRIALLLEEEAKAL
jgi:hypothetical protein